MVLRDLSVATVREPGSSREAGASDTGADLSAEAYAEMHGLRVLCAVPARVMRGVLALAVPERSAALVKLGGPLLAVAHVAFGGVDPVGNKS